jgi:hypothetical protein
MRGNNIIEKWEYAESKGLNILPIYFISPKNAKKLNQEDYLNWFNYQIEIRGRMILRPLTDEEKEIFGCNLYKKII